MNTTLQFAFLITVLWLRQYDESYFIIILYHYYISIIHCYIWMFHMIYICIHLHSTHIICVSLNINHILLRYNIVLSYIIGVWYFIIIHYGINISLHMLLYSVIFWLVNWYYVIFDCAIIQNLSVQLHLQPRVMGESMLAYFSLTDGLFLCFFWLIQISNKNRIQTVKP